MTVVRYGIIGSGMMGQEHIRNIALIGGARVTAVADPDEGMRTQAAALTGAEAFADHRALLSADLCDAYVIAAPNHLHHGLLRDAMTTPKPIMVEKPLCTTSADCREVLGWAEGRAAPVWVAMEYRYMPPAARLIELVHGGAVGTPRMLSIREHRFPFLPKVGDWNRFNANTGGTLIEKCCHFWDLMRLILRDDPARVYASAAVDVNHRDERYGGRAPDIVDNAYVVVDFAGGARGMLDLCMFAEGSTWQEVICATGELAEVEARVPGPARFRAVERPAEVAVSDRVSQRVTTQVIEVDQAVMAAGDHHGSTFYQHQKFLELVRTGQGTPEVTLEDGLWSVRVGEAAEESARTGQSVEL